MTAQETAIDAYLARQTSRTVPDGHRLLTGYFRWLPVLWLSGVHVVSMTALVVWLGIRRWPADAVVNGLFVLWFLAGSAQAVAIVYNWSLLGEGMGQLAGRLLSFTILGWYFLGLGLAVGRSWNLAGPPMVRSFMVLGLWFAVMSAVFYTVSFTTDLASLSLRTPLSMLLGNRPIVEFYTLAIPYDKEESSFGLVRLILFYPWSTALSLMGIVTLLVSTCETNSRWRAIGIAGGLCAVAFSFSRAGYATLPVALAVTLMLRSRPAFLLGCVVASCLAALMLVMFEIRPDEVIDALIAEMRASRAGSSQFRDLIYEASWNGFLDSPVFGQGSFAEVAFGNETLVLGSHSTIYGVLYTGGASTFACVALAGIATLLATLVNAFRVRTPAAAAGAGSMVAFAIFSYGEGLSTLVLPLLGAILFIGGSLSPRTVTRTTS